MRRCILVDLLDEDSQLVGGPKSVNVLNQPVGDPTQGGAVSGEQHGPGIVLVVRLVHQLQLLSRMKRRKLEALVTDTGHEEGAFAAPIPGLERVDEVEGVSGARSTSPGQDLHRSRVGPQTEPTEVMVVRRALLDMIRLAKKAGTTSER